MLLLIALLLLVVIFIGIAISVQNKRIGLLYFLMLFACLAIYMFRPFLILSTDLSGEAIGPFEINKQLNEEIIAELGRYSKREVDNGYYYQNDLLFISTEVTGVIQSISMGNANYVTKRGVGSGDSVEDVEERYGRHYYTYQEMGLGEAMVYRDRREKISLTFWFVEGKIRTIWLSSKE
ncbi:hypothetical protein [Alkalihalobacillus pseudalcaliphilus]|uniref:hypothetical protein n=1 Tax=Alkalihalobacillus pseudalcaliphilus TaxID=79884 RepID=UPI00064DA728|nr:hypothetical protein [Alkalihalobacillus pseudalcaliphilus]KMK74406.1 hypothetical protein AB990_21080 [Alkalihalobacillus pseudalcaliphilus]